MKTKFRFQNKIYDISNGRFQIDEDAARNVLARTGLGEEGVEGVITATDGFVGGHLAIRLDTVLETEPKNLKK